MNKKAISTFFRQYPEKYKQLAKGRWSTTTSFTYLCLHRLLPCCFSPSYFLLREHSVKIESRIILSEN
ncbi:hypothetical protein HMPREF0083_02015 [Aneurinibacillus aneurinilyticus ATCC 12856]|uniref:Uncharacterized protein n=1 Tax=Aneurinibacillus aneurinilyticus ATCC 12856 TaxID=649747 RepID=U1X4L7_ANEAE|nr:hypothetical protein HMPREF0083_02015 [Aneurinibacillus aneurinilyticus ATCC 12856]